MSERRDGFSAPLNDTRYSDIIFKLNVYSNLLKTSINWLLDTILLHKCIFDCNKQNLLQQKHQHFDVMYTV